MEFKNKTNNYQKCQSAKPCSLSPEQYFFLISERIYLGSAKKAFQGKVLTNGLRIPDCFSKDKLSSQRM